MTTVTASSDVRVVVDRMLRVDKVPTGDMKWVDEHREGDMRLLLPLIIEGEVSDANLQVIAYPRARPLKFRINLLWGRAIWRLDYVHDEEHVNAFDRPADVPSGPFTCPHYHTWHDNRRFATKVSLPEKLDNARILDTNLLTFSNTFRWFCGQTRISLSSFEPPDLPVSDRLL